MRVSRELKVAHRERSAYLLGKEDSLQVTLVTWHPGSSNFYTVTALWCLHAMPWPA